MGISPLHTSVGVSWLPPLLLCHCSSLPHPSPTTLGPELACSPTGLGGKGSLSVWCLPANGGGPSQHRALVELYQVTNTELIHLYSYLPLKVFFINLQF